MDAGPVYIAGLDGAVCAGPVSARWPLLLTSDGVLIDDSFMRRRDRCWAPEHVRELSDGYELIADVRHAPLLAGEYVLFGTLFEHFGHFLTEGLARAWLPGEDATYVTFRPLSTPWQRATLEALGIRRVHRVTEPTRFERLIVPSRACILGHYMTPELGTTYARLRDSVEPASARRIYLSRARLRSGRRLVNEDDVEERFRAHDFRIVHPEQLSMEEQMSLVAGADVVAGTGGSNMYLGAFQRAGGRRLIVSPPRWCPPDDALISHVVGTTLSYAFGHEVAGASDEARHADYVADISDVDAAIEHVLDD